MTAKNTRAHEDATIEMLARDPVLASEYLSAAFEEINEPGGEVAFLSALRQIALAREGGMARVARQAGMKREALSRALSPKGNPTLKTLISITRALGLRLDARPGSGYH
jgi:probable addiction module antidote protein